MSPVEDTSTNSSSAVDRSVLDELISQVGADDGEFREDLIGSYLAEASDQVARLSAALDNGDSDTAAGIAHSLRSASALLGAVHFAQLLGEAERMAKTASDDMAQFAKPVHAEFARVASALTTLSVVDDIG